MCLTQLFAYSSELAAARGRPVGFGNAFWICAPLCAVATGFLVARMLPPGGRQSALGSQ